ncbi:DNA-3-methyladenine glycosylase 2 family protein, partial [Asanoa sp. NPDC050611]
RAVDGFETTVRAIVGQQISVAATRTILGRIAERSGKPGFPDAETVADLPDDAFPMPAARRETIRGLARAVADGTVDLDLAADREELVDSLVALPGIGAWTAGYVAMRAAGDPDVFLPTDLAVRRGAKNLGLPDDPKTLEAHAASWRPWRSYALIRLWRNA